MNYSEFETLLSVKKKDLNLKILAADISADFLDTIENKHATSEKIRLAHEKLKPPQFKKFCKLIPLSYSAGCRHVKVAKLMHREGCREKLKHIDSWDTLHALSILEIQEYWHFMHMVGNTGEHFTKGDVEQYNRVLRKQRLKTQASNIYFDSASLTFNFANTKVDDARSDLLKLFEFSKKLPNIEVIGNFEELVKKARSLNQCKIETNNEEIEEIKWYIVHVNDAAAKLQEEIKNPEADKTIIVKKIRACELAIGDYKKWIDDLVKDNEVLAKEGELVLIEESYANDDDYLPDVYKKKSNN